LFVIIFLRFPTFISKLKKSHLFVWNVFFIFAMLLAILLHTIQFPATPESATVVVEKSTPIDAPALFVVILSPILFINFGLFTNSLQSAKTSRLAWPLVLGAFFFVILIFILIFTNVWGYVGEVSRWFRNKFYLSFLLAGVGMLMPILFIKNLSVDARSVSHKKIWIVAVVMIASITMTNAITREAARVTPPDKVDQLTIMSYNIQQGVNVVGTKNYENQLALIKKVNPDILCLQESDVARLSGGNSDVVRYFAQRLKFHSYYGPKTVTGTFGTAILSRFPLHQCRTIFSFSDVDEIGTSLVEIKINGKTVVVFNSHPAGSPAAKHAHVDALIENLKSCDYVIAAGDFNFREDSPYYAKMTAFLQDSWLARWPTGVGDMSTVAWSFSQRHDPSAVGGWEKNDVLDMQNRIDHIFLSQNFDVINSIYLPVPESQSDHPAHWAIIRFVE
jgi:endonuclease/exonuclease/phosphatase family metal-dependent hydrolase